MLNRMHTLSTTSKRSIISGQLQILFSRQLHVNVNMNVPCISNHHHIQEQNQMQHRGRHRRLTSSTTRSTSTTTFYDSQSGMDVALHNENEISLFARNWGSDVFKWDNRIKSIKEAGFHGLDTNWRERNIPVELKVDRISSISTKYGSPEEFKVFLDSVDIVDAVSSSSSSSFQKKGADKKGNSLCTIFDYGFFSDDRAALDTHLNETLKYFNSSNYSSFKTVLGISNSYRHNSFRTVYGDNHDPIMVANGVATLIDETGCGDLVWLEAQSEDNKSENVIALLEELSYLDIPGQTMKSRLVVDMAATEPDLGLGYYEHLYENGERDDDEFHGDKIDWETLEECLSMGINKFVIDEINLDRFKSTLKDHGKRLA